MLIAIMLPAAFFAVAPGDPVAPQPSYIYVERAKLDCALASERKRLATDKDPVVLFLKPCPPPAHKPRDAYPVLPDGSRALANIKVDTLLSLTKAQLNCLMRDPRQLQRLVPLDMPWLYRIPADFDCKAAR